MEDIKLYFKDNFIELDKYAVYELNKTDNGPINNVIQNLNEHCYGIHIYEDKPEIQYFLFYIDNKNELKGLGLYLSFDIDLKTRVLMTTEFCKLINFEFPHSDIVDTFNTFQIQSRSAFEKSGFYTLGNEINNIPNGSEILVTNIKGIIRFPTLNKLNLYRWLFDENENFVKIDPSRIKKVYLLLDSKNNLIKIGQSYNPKLREKTLQGINPNWDLITTWIAPISEEKKLHKFFKNKNTRGEWFDLSFSDLKTIKTMMKKFK